MASDVLFAPSVEGRVKLGRLLADARTARGWSLRDMVREIFDRTGLALTAQQILNYEDGTVKKPSMVFFGAFHAIELLSTPDGRPLLPEEYWYISCGSYDFKRWCIVR